MKKFKEIFEKQYFVSIDIACPKCFDGNITKEANMLNVDIIKIKGKDTDTRIEGHYLNVISILERMGVNKKDLQKYIDHWEK